MNMRYVPNMYNICMVLPTRCHDCAVHVRDKNTQDNCACPKSEEKKQSSRRIKHTHTEINGLMLDSSPSLVTGRIEDVASNATCLA